MEVWNREELYNEIWEQPLVKLAAKYGISAVMLGKVCRKLKIPLPGRGYWAKKEFGKPVTRVPLPDAKDLPVVQRFKSPDANGATASQNSKPEPGPTDPEWMRAVEVESRSIESDPEAKQHKLIVATARNLKNARTDQRGILERRYSQPCLDIRVSQGALERALKIMNAILLALESEGAPVRLEDGKIKGPEIFGHRVSFELVERVHEKSRREVKETPTSTRTVIEYEPSGILEFRVGEYGCSGRRAFRDGKKRRLEDLLPQCVGAFFREARDLKIRAEQAKQREIERQKKQREMAELSLLIQEEEKKVRDFEGWVTAWARAQQMRDFIAALEKLWAEQGHDLSPDAPKGQRIVWMKQQADRMDPMLPSPPSILDRKGELSSWW
jgi:hypothetical protein